jgi:hypothetical protein
MTNPYEVPLEELEQVQVQGEALVQEQPLRWAAGAALVHPFGDGMTGDADGD